MLLCKKPKKCYHQLMLPASFSNTLIAEIDRLDKSSSSKRRENIIAGFTAQASPRAIINGQEYLVFNSNDYLGLRFHPELKKGEHEASEKYGTGPGAVRFIAGTLQVYKDLEASIAKFHGRDDAIIFSSAFAANLAVLHALIKGQSKDSLVSSDTLVISDQLNHRSIVDGIRVANLPDSQRMVFSHMNSDSLDHVLSENVGKFSRCLVVTDGVFSMLGEFQDLACLRKVIASYQDKYTQGILLVVDDSHGVGAFGTSGRGTEEVTGAAADVLIGTFGKALGADGGYAVGDQIVIDYLREAAATYIYSNPPSPGTAGAALAAVKLLSAPEGKLLLESSRNNIAYFKEKAKAAGLVLAADSCHPIQPLLVGSPEKAASVREKLFSKGILASAITYPVVPAGRDELRFQITSIHTASDIDNLVQALA